LQLTSDSQQILAVGPQKKNSRRLISRYAGDMHNHTLEAHIPQGPA
jgi:hypothetical protein